MESRLTDEEKEKTIRLRWASITEFFASEFKYLKQIDHLVPLLKQKDCPKNLLVPYEHEDAVLSNMKEDELLAPVFKKMEAVSQTVGWKVFEVNDDLAAKREFVVQLQKELQEYFNNDLEYAVSVLLFAVNFRINAEGLQIYETANLVREEIRKSLKLKNIADPGHPDHYIANTLIIITQRYPRYSLLLNELKKSFKDTNIEADLDKALVEAQLFSTIGDQSLKAKSLTMLRQYLIKNEMNPDTSFEMKSQAFMKILDLIASLPEIEKMKKINENEIVLMKKKMKKTVVSNIKKEIFTLILSLGPSSEFISLLNKLIEDCKNEFDEVLSRGRNMHNAIINREVGDFEIVDISEVEPAAHLNAPSSMFYTPSVELGEREKEKVGENAEKKADDYLKAARIYFENYKDKNKTDYKNRHAHFKALEKMISNNAGKEEIDKYIKDGIKAFSPQLGIGSKRYADILRDIRVHLHVGEGAKPTKLRRQT